MFYGSNSIMGDTREIWFINTGLLYEVTTYKQARHLAHPHHANLAIHPLTAAPRTASRPPIDGNNGAYPQRYEQRDGEEYEPAASFHGREGHPADQGKNSKAPRRTECQIRSAHVPDDTGRGTLWEDVTLPRGRTAAAGSGGNVSPMEKAERPPHPSSRRGDQSARPLPQTKPDRTAQPRPRRASPLLKSVSRPASNPHAPHVRFPCAPARKTVFDFRELSSRGARVPQRTAVLYFPRMDKDTKDILEAVNFIKDRMATKDDLAAAETRLSRRIEKLDTKLTKFEDREIDKRLQLEVRVSAIEKHLGLPTSRQH